MTPGDPKSICSLRTEQCGAFGIALLAQILCIRHSITATDGYLNFFIDNDTVIKRLKYSVRPEMGSTKHCKKDDDIPVWVETVHILNCLPCTSTFTHVKGHQDDALYAFCKVRSPLPRIASLQYRDGQNRSPMPYCGNTTNDDDSSPDVQDRTGT